MNKEEIILKARDFSQQPLPLRLYSYAIQNDVSSFENEPDSLIILKNNTTLSNCTFNLTLESTPVAFGDFPLAGSVNDAAYRPIEDVNTKNTSDFEKFKRELSGRITLALHDDPIEPGVEGLADEIFAKAAAINKMAANQWLSHLFLTHFCNPPLCTSIVLLAGRISYENAKPAAVAIAVGALAHKETSVREAGVRAFENWGAPENIEILENINTSPLWLKNYINSVIKDLRSNI